MKCEEARKLLSDHLEQYLTEPEAGLLTEHLAHCADCRAELEDLKQTLEVMRELPSQEPVADLWQEFAPKFAEIRAQQSMGLWERIWLPFLRIFSALREGWRLLLAGLRYSWGGA